MLQQWDMSLMANAEWIDTWFSVMAVCQNGRNFTDDIFKCIFFNENDCIFIQISLIFFLRAVKNDTTLVHSNNGLALNRRQAVFWTNKNIHVARHTAHTIVPWPNPKQWLMIHTSHLIMMIRWSTHILKIITRGMGKLKKDSPIYCIKWGKWINLRHTLDRIYLRCMLYIQCPQTIILLFHNPTPSNC